MPSQTEYRQLANYSRTQLWFDLPTYFILEEKRTVIKKGSQAHSPQVGHGAIAVVLRRELGALPLLLCLREDLLELMGPVAFVPDVHAHVVVLRC